MLRFAANRTARTDDLLPTIDIPQSLYFSTDPHFGAIDITERLDRRLDRDDAGRLHAGRLPALRHADLEQGLARRRSRASTCQNYHFDGFSFSRYGGEFRFTQPAEFLTLQRSGTAQADRFTGNLPGTDTFRQMRQRYVAFFVQDDWRASTT